MTAKKTKTTTAASPAKVMDIAHPGTLKTAATPTGRPVIVTNRVIIQDPMVNAAQAKDSEKAKPAEAAPLKEKLVIRPLSDPVEPVSDDKADDDKEIDITTATKEGLLDIPAEDGDADNLSDHTNDPPAKPEPKEAEVEEPEAKPEEKAPAEEPEAKPDPEPADDQETKAAEPAEKADDSKESSDEPGEPLSAGKAAAKEAADAKIQQEIDESIENKEYFLPINAVEKRRSRVVSIIGVILILLLIAAWLNIALDAGFVEIPGVQPLTDLFG